MNEWMFSRKIEELGKGDHFPKSEVSQVQLSLKGAVG